MKQNMKNNFSKVACVLCLSSQFVFSQSKVEVQTIELVSNGKSSKSKIVETVYNPENKESRLTFMTTWCDGAGQYDEVRYTFEHLTFDGNFNFKKFEEEKINGLGNAIFKYPVLGVNQEIKSLYDYNPGANKNGGWLSQMEYVVKGNSNAGICTQSLAVQKTKMEPIPFQGGNVLFKNTTSEGVMVVSQNSTAENNITVQFFDHQGVSKKQSSFKIDYGFALKGLTLKNEKGGEDIVLIIQPTAKYNKYGIKVEKVKTNPLEFEYIRVDGNSMQVKERALFNAISTQWIPEYLVENNGAVYVFGQASQKVKMNDYHFGGVMTTEGLDFQNYIRVDKLENYQFIKAKNGVVEYVTNLTPADMAGVEKLVDGAKGKNKASGYFRKQEIKIIDDKIYITGQNTKVGSAGDDRSQEFLMMIDEKGKLTNLFYIPKSNYANSNMFFSSDKKTMYWAIYDYSNYSVYATRFLPTQIGVTGTVIGGDDHSFDQKRTIDEGPELQIVKFDLTNNTSGSLEVFGKDEYTLFDEVPVLYSNEKEVVFIGVAGKLKERQSKVIRLTL
jgi:hypothetical protein